ncbi:MAG: UDP-N-acetylmuramoyl-L-alanine--D-glutamate ligase [Emcibacter sp.]|nr:UDP-N-acetylmuramoyl-L-alanine--D-glutamate ligase [Emcibacter sp.]
MTLSDLETKRIAIWGLGKEGLESYRTLRRRFPTKPILLINQKRPVDLPEDDNSSFLLEEDMEQHIKDIDVVVKAPGISLYHPLVTRLKQQGVHVTSATNLWFAQAVAGIVIAITGSNGKSTTSALLAHILTGLGHRTAFGGNIGTPLLSLDPQADYYVVELSSYQTADLTYAPDIAVLLNLFPEHIQWHHSHDQYFTDKCNLIRTGAKTVLLNRTDPLTRKILTSEMLKDIPATVLWFNDPQGLHIQGDFIVSGNAASGNDIIGPIKDITLPGSHNQENICAALTLCRALKLDLKACFKLAASYGGLPHRLETLGRHDAITYINDSISTTPEAAIAALKSFEGRSITLIAGGEDRAQDYTGLAKYAADHPKITVITLYETGDRISTALRDAGAMSVLTVHDLTDAVRKSQEVTPDGGIILLSPAAPSYDAFQNFEARGEKFRALYKDTC